MTHEVTSNNHLATAILWLLPFVIKLKYTPLHQKELVELSQGSEVGSEFRQGQEFSLFLNDQTGFEEHPSSCLIGPEVLFLD
jgi:hypothetical protein